MDMIDTAEGQRILFEDKNSAEIFDGVILEKVSDDYIKIHRQNRNDSSECVWYDSDEIDILRKLELHD